MGSIPAHAGQPSPLPSVRPALGVYPRSRGATTIPPLPARSMPGLSPLTRGNRSARIGDRLYCGSIPAHAGQPHVIPNRERREGVYPRSRGATAARGVWPRSMSGLSPLTRGNQHCPQLLPAPRGSIPAHAGQPSRCSGTGSSSWVYPRSRGATTGSAGGMPSARGLSPLTRGNLHKEPAHPAACGSIPAHAGQPNAPAEAETPLRVYPRSRGATHLGSVPLRCASGLSPLTRGNRHKVGKWGVALGSIPAHAGQPSL